MVVSCVSVDSDGISYADRQQWAVKTRSGDRTECGGPAPRGSHSAPIESF